VSRRTALLGAATLVFVVVSFAPALATATAELACHGRAATLAGTPGQVLQGTAGADVMVTNGATEAYAGGGDDLVCVTPAAERVFISGDAGDDTIDATTAGPTGAVADLGAGHDTYTGGDGPDGVQAGRWWKDVDGFAPDDDVVTTGGGIDHVTTGGHLSFPDADTIDLGPGPDTLTIFGDTSAAGSWSAGAGSDTLEVERATRSGRWKLDNRAGRASVDGLSIGRWDSLERFVASRFPAGSTLLFRGGSRPERLTLFGPPTVASMGGGDDFVDVEVGRRMLAEGLRLEAGPGHDLRYGACSGSVSAGAGDDAVEFRGKADWGCLDPTVVPVRGGAGNDTLVGGGLDDRLVGGRGDDHADGRGGDDVCVAEHTRRCEA
jgi:Ca2+-binding RTX toxin-like protein